MNPFTLERKIESTMKKNHQQASKQKGRRICFDRRSEWEHKPFDNGKAMRSTDYGRILTWKSKRKNLLRHFCKLEELEKLKIGL